MTAPDRPEATNPALPVRDQLSEAQRVAETLAALDWGTYRCQCRHKHACDNPAAYIVHIHCIDNCNNPDADPFGNRIEIRCSTCLVTLRTDIAAKLRQLKPWGQPACAGCGGAPIAEITDVIRDVTPLTFAEPGIWS